MAGKKGSKPYPFAVKLLAVHLFLDEGYRYSEIVQKLGLSSRDLLNDWIHIYRREGEAGLSKKKGRPKKDPESYKVRIAQLEMENELLKKFHTELRKDGLARRNIGSSNLTERDTQ